MEGQEGFSRPSGNGEAPGDYNCGDLNEKNAVVDEEDYSGNDYGEDPVDEGISQEMAEIFESRGKRLKAFIEQKREEVGALQDRILSQRGYVKRRGAGRR